MVAAWRVTALCLLALTTSALPVQDGDSATLVQMTGNTDKSYNVEVSNINERIFDDTWEKSNFEQRKADMNQIVSASVTQEDRLKDCKGNCGEGVKLFTVWTTPAEGWNSKFTHAVDSALYLHPKAQVSIYSSSLPEDFLEDFHKLGYDVHVERINMKERAAGTPLESWADKLDEWHNGPFYYAHLSDATRLLVLYKEGGVYFDTDVVFVNPIDNVRNAVGWERADSLCNAMMAFDKGNLYLKEVLARFSEQYVMDDWAANGPALLTDVYMDSFKHSDQINAMDQSAFYLIQWDEVQHFFERSRPSDIDRDLHILKQKALVVHFWNSRSHDLIVHPDSLMARMFNMFCVYCNPISHPILAIVPPADKKDETEKLVALMS